MSNSKLYKKIKNEDSNDSGDDNEFDKNIDIERRNKNNSSSHISLSLMFNPSFILFSIGLISSFVFILYWFNDQDVTFIVCGIVGLLISIFGIFKFRALLQFKNILQLKKNENLKCRIEEKKLKSQINRTKEALKILKDAKHRLQQTNSENYKNYQIFERIQDEIKIKLESKKNLVNDTSKIAQLWKNQNEENETETISKIYNRFIQDIVGQHSIIITQLQINQFEEMLPIEMRERFAMIDIFNQLYENGQKNGIDCRRFEKYLQHKFIKMDINMLTPNRNHNNKNNNKVMNKRVSFNTAQNKLSLYTPSPPTPDVQNNEYDNNPYNNNNSKNGLKDKDKDKNNMNDIVTIDTSKSKSPPAIIVNQESTDYSTDPEYDDGNHDSNDSNDSNNSGNDEDNDKTQNKKSRKIGKLKHNWGQNKGENKGRYTPKGKIIKRDNSWVKHKLQKPVHPLCSLCIYRFTTIYNMFYNMYNIHRVHESVDELEINKLVTQAQIVRALTPVDESSDDHNDGEIHTPTNKKKIKKLKRKKSRDSPRANTPASPAKIVHPDDSWIEHTKKAVHPVHESVDALAIQKLVSSANIVDMLDPVGEDQEQ